jgi:hypothetical protein
MFFLVGAEFISARKPAGIMLRVGINPATTSNARFSMNTIIVGLKMDNVDYVIKILD